MTCKRHNCIIVTRRRWQEWFRMTYWAVCFRCNELFGPSVDAEDAWRKACDLNAENWPIRRDLET